MKYTRRQFLETAVAGACTGAVLLNSCSSGPRFHDPFEKVELGKTGIKTTRLSMGTGIRASNRQSALTRLGNEQAEALVREIYDRGVRHFDLADSYGSHEVVSNALKIYPRSDYQLFTKLWFLRGRNIPEGVRPGEEAEAEVMRFLEELQTDYIDGLQLHYITTGDWNTQLSDYMNVLANLKQRGIIRSHGVSCHSQDAIETAISEAWVDTIHVRINPYGVNMDIQDVDKVANTVKLLNNAGKSVTAMKIIGQGDLADSEEQKDNSFKFVLDLNAVDVLTIGMDKISDLEDSAARIRKVEKIT